MSTTPVAPPPLGPGAASKPLPFKTAKPTRAKARERYQTPLPHPLVTSSWSLNRDHHRTVAARPAMNSEVTTSFHANDAARNTDLDAESSDADTMIP